MKSELLLDKVASELRGRMIQKVSSRGVVAQHSDYHSVSEAVYLVVDARETYKITFDGEFGSHWGYGISIEKVADSPMLSDTIIDVSDELKNYVDSPVIASHINWRYIEQSRKVLFHHFNRQDYPQDIDLIFENGKTLSICVAKIIDQKTTKLFTNYLTLFFDNAVRDTYYERANVWMS